MLPPHNRMRSRLDFTETVRCGRRAGRRDVVVHLLAGGSAKVGSRAIAEPCASKAGLIVGKQVGGAVIRKKVSRRLRAALGSVLPEFPPSSRLVVRALPSSAQAEVVDLEGQLRSAMRKLAPAAPGSSNGSGAPEKKGTL